jgi:hypothetical protein
MSQFRNIKDLVIQTCVKEGRFPSEEKLTAMVRQHFPSSKWHGTHYAWYKSHVKTGKILVPGISVEGSLEASPQASELAIEESIEASLSLERDLHNYLAARVSKIEMGLKVVESGIEFHTEAGNIDILARDKDGRLVVIELKAGTAKDSALGQLLGYMGCIATTEPTVRGILVASDFDQRVIFGAKGLASVKLIKYQVSFELQEVK